MMHLLLRLLRWQLMCQRLLRRQLMCQRLLRWQLRWRRWSLLQFIMPLF